MPANIALVTPGQVTPEQHSVLVQQAFTAIDTASTVEDLKKVRDQWTGLTAYARAAKDKQLEADAAEIRMRVERKLGLLMQAQKEEVGFHKGGGDQRSDQRGFKNPADPPTLAEAGIDKNLAKKARNEAAKTEEQFEEDVAEKKSGILEGNGKHKADLDLEAGEKVTAAHDADAAIDDGDDDADNWNTPCRRKDGRFDLRLKRFKQAIFIAGGCGTFADLKFPPTLTAEMATEAAKRLDEAIGEYVKDRRKLKARLVAYASSSEAAPADRRAITAGSSAHSRRSVRSGFFETRVRAARGCAMTFERILHGYVASQLAYRTKSAGSGQPNWRAIERMLIAFFVSHRVHIVDVAGMPTIEIIRCWEGDEASAVTLSVEALAKYLAQETAA